jgi:NitT/TauT family transport system substrate-binding protein
MVHGGASLSQLICPRRAFLLASLGSLASGSLSAAEPPRPSLRVSIALAARQSLYHLPLTLAEQLGYFRQSGLVVDWVSQEGGSKALASVLSGQADVVAGAFEHLFGLQQKGLAYQGFVQMGRAPQVALGVSMRKGAAMRSVMELRGARIGVSAMDSSTHWMACQWLLQHGLLPEDVSFVEVGASSNVVDALRNGTIDALSNPDPVMHWLEQKNEVRILGDARSIAATRKAMAGDVPGACLFARAEFLHRQPEVVQALSDGVIHALKWLQTAGPTDILKNIPPAYWLGDRAIYLGAFEKLRESYAMDGLFDAQAVLNVWQAHARLMGYGPTSRQALERLYINSFAGKSKTRFAA